jgi:hypothetical protein
VVDRNGRLDEILNRVDVPRVANAGRPSAFESLAPAGVDQKVGQVMDLNMPRVPVDAELAEMPSS